MSNDKNTFGISKRSHPTRLVQIVARIRTWGFEWKKQIDKTNEWAPWQWMNAKIVKESPTLLKQIVNMMKEDMEDYHSTMFT
jgi:hypothetical protein